ncbi:hypothetical protein ASE46_00750 [Bacillus sp. Root239]|nr:hypothetical protein ASE46_00750 [Bacillus sp. Root239]
MKEIIKILSVKPKKKTDDIVNNIYTAIKGKLNFKENKKYINSDFGLQMFNEVIKLEAQLNYKEKNYEIVLNKKTFKDENIILETTLISQHESVNLNDDIYELKLELKQVLSLFFKGVYWQKDTQNEKTCSELYGKIHTLENRFRELIVQFMVNKYGFSWTKTQISEELNKKINEFSKWYRDNYTVFKNVKTELFNLQVNDLIILLTKAYDDKNISDQELITYIKEDDVDLDHIMQKVNDYKKGLVQLNVWDKYFQPLLGVQFNKLWSKFNHMRNMVAHNKPICLELYNDTNKTIHEIDQIFDLLVEDFNENFRSTEDIEIDELFLELDEQYNESNNRDFLYFEELGIELTPTEDEVLNEITEDEQIQSLIEKSNRYISDYLGYIEETTGFLEDIERKLDFSDHSEVKQTLEEISHYINVYIKKEENPYLHNLSSGITDEDFEDIWVDLKSDILDYLEELEDTVVTSKVKKEFPLEVPLVEIRTSNLELKIISQGFIAPERGSLNNLLMFLIKDGIQIEGGLIQKNYGDYLVNEYGGADACHSDELIVDIDEIVDTFSELLEDELDLIREIRDEFDYYI